MITEIQPKLLCEVRKERERWIKTENHQGSEVRDAVGEIQKLQEKQAKDMRRNEMMDDDDSSVRAEPRVSGDWNSLRAALETAFVAMGNSDRANRNSPSSLRSVKVHRQRRSMQL
uniref:Shootin-1 n=1 Tax=Haemonchus contortus TaxID=6289 RepID=A0A7I4XSF4_HAECO